MSRYVSDPLELPVREPGEAFSRVDLIFYGVDHSGPSYEARVFLDSPRASAKTARDATSGYVGSFTVFGHGGCYGDVGHCDVVPRTDPFDVRPPHPLTPWTKTLIVPADIAAALPANSVRVTVVPVVPGKDGPEELDGFTLDRIRISAYVD